MSAILTVKKSNYYKKNVTVRYTDGTPYVLANKRIIFTVKSKQDVLPNDDKAFIEKIITTFTNASLGQFDLEIAETDTVNMKIGDYKFDFRIEDLTVGQPANTMQGTFILEPIVTTAI
jgi:hypothetical protein